VQDMSKVSINH